MQDSRGICSTMVLYTCPEGLDNAMVIFSRRSARKGVSVTSDPMQRLQHWKLNIPPL